jgi:transposase
LEDPEWLREQYYEKERSTIEIAEECGAGTNTVRRWFNRHGIELMDMGTARAEGDVKLLQDEEWLREQYFEHDRSTVEIADELGVSTSTVRRNMNYHDMEARSIAEAMTGGDFEQLQDREWMYEMYVEKTHTATEIGNEVGVTPGTVITWLERHEIEVRDSPNYYEFDHLSHIVRSQWERQFAELLIELDIEYEYESAEFEYRDDRIYTPDFTTDQYVIEVKGQVNSYAIQRAEGILPQLDDYEYVIVGSSDAVDLIPADHHYKWGNRRNIDELF